MAALVDEMKEMDQAMRSEMKSYLEEFFRVIEKPASMKSRLIDSCKAAPYM